MWVYDNSLSFWKIIYDEKLKKNSFAIQLSIKTTKFKIIILIAIYQNLFCKEQY